MTVQIQVAKDKTCNIKYSAYIIRNNNNIFGCRQFVANLAENCPVGETDTEATFCVLEFLSYVSGRLVFENWILSAKT